MRRPDVAVTGLGLLCGLGADLETSFRALVQGTSGVRDVHTLDTREQPSRIGAEVPGFFPDDGDPSQEAPDHPDRLEKLLRAAVREAAGEGLSELGAYEPERIGLAVGTSLGGWRRVERAMRARHEGRQPSAADLLGGSFTAPCTAMAADLGIRGPVWVLSNACAAGTVALVVGATWIRNGRADVVIAAGVDVLTAMTYAGFHAVRAANPEGIRPFDRQRQGLVLGEGAGALVLERADRAEARGRPIRARLLGCGLASDAFGMVRPDPEGAGVVRAAQAALEDAGLEASAVDFVSAHGTGTAYNDPMETRAFKRIFGPRAPRVPMHSIKSMIGHTLGAAGAIEAVVCVRVLEEGIIPPTINLVDPDPECDLDWVPNVARTHPVAVALSSSSAFAGNNAAVVLGRGAP